MPKNTDQVHLDRKPYVSHEIMKPAWTRLEYTWQIDNFWEIRALGSIEALDDSGGAILWSRRFGDEKHGVWRLKCYPYGDTSDAGRTNVSLFLNLDTDTYPEMNAYAIFGCSILDENGTKVPGSGRSFTRQKFGKGADSWGWSQFIKVEGHSLSRMLSNNQSSLVIRCDVDIFMGLERCPGFPVPPARSLKDDIVCFATRPENCDVVVRYGKDGSDTYSGNAFIMKARCAFFEELLSGTKSPSSPDRQVTTTTHSNQPPPPPMEQSTSEEEFGSFEDEQEPLPGALYQRTSGIKTKKKKPAVNPNGTVLADVHSAIISNHSDVQPIFATLSKDEHGGSVITIDPIFTRTVVHAFLTHIHVGENPFTSPDLIKFPAFNSTLTDVCELVQLAHQAKCSALYWEAVVNLAGRMVTKEDALVVGVVAQEIGCKALKEQASLLAVDCFRHPDKDELLKLILPKSMYDTFKGSVGSRRRRRVPVSASDDE